MLHDQFQESLEFSARVSKGILSKIVIALIFSFSGLLALACGLILALVITFQITGYEFRYADQIANYFGVPIVGAILFGTIAAFTYCSLVSTEDDHIQ